MRCTTEKPNMKSLEALDRLAQCKSTKERWHDQCEALVKLGKFDIEAMGKAIAKCKDGETATKILAELDAKDVAVAIGLGCAAQLCRWAEEDIRKLGDAN